ncbi:hypothetical protein [Bradyrhizobium shewense]|uniref:hypothetical protein n=1 Tax=Bradyrhizobium shewense TaxID=1761772 RepID=UPI000B89E40D|nr:hypothetical protein [Bradyrhizobium shewense]
MSSYVMRVVHPAGLNDCLIWRVPYDDLTANALNIWGSIRHQTFLADGRAMGIFQPQQLPIECR